jgi:hypothetical protein
MIEFVGLVRIKTTTPPQAMAAAVVLLLLLAVALFACLVGIVRRINGRRGSDFIHGVCGHCGYSLRGLPSTICPECGSDTKVVNRRPVRGGGAGRWIACGVWIALLLAVNSVFRLYIEAHFLRLISPEYADSIIAGPPMEKAKLYRRLFIVALMAGGVTVILFASRKSRWPGPADEYRD